MSWGVTRGFRREKINRKPANRIASEATSEWKLEIARARKNVPEAQRGISAMYSKGKGWRASLEDAR